MSIRSQQKKDYVLKNRKYGSNFFTRLLGAFSSQDIPTDKTLGVDTSHWNGFSDYVKMKSKGVKFGISKASDVGWGSKKEFLDGKAVYNWKNMGEAGILRGAYCWLDPNRYSTPESQAYFYLQEFYFKYPTEFPPVLDFEDRPVISASEMLWRAEVWLEIVEKETGEIPIVYTSPGYMAQFDRKKSGFLSRYPLWVAHYIQRTYPTIPYPWDKYLIWQYSNLGHYPYYVYPATTAHGKEWGSESSYLDMNWFNGTYFDMLKYLEEDAPVDPPPVPPEEPEDYLFKAKCVVDALNVREGPSINFTKKRIIRRGDIVNVYDEQNNWYKISEKNDEWVAGYPQYMEKFSEEDILFKAKCVAYALNVRLGPSTNHPIKKVIHMGKIVNVYNVKNNWYKISDTLDEWVSGYPQYMEKI